MNNSNDKYWKVEEIRPYIMKFIKEKFPESIMMREFDDIDIMVFGPNIPVEIQRSYLHKGRHVRISEFEDNTRRQIEVNIKTHDVCWFFMDQNFLDYLSNNSNRLITLDMIWLYQYFKEGSVKIFSITIDGYIRELTDSDLSILTKFVITDSDRNRSKIAFKMLKNLNYTTEEITNWYDEFENDSKNGKRRTDKKIRFANYLDEGNPKKKKLADIMYAISNIRYIRELLSCNMSDHYSTTIASILGIIEGVSKNHRHQMIRCTDNYNIIEYFPEYFENKELWDYWRTHAVDYTVFTKVVKGEYPDYLKDRKYDLDYHFGIDKNSIDTNKDIQTDDDNDTNIVIKNKYQIIDINIKRIDTTIQKNIEESWS